MDVKSDFLNANLSEEIYMQQPPGFITSKTSSLVCKLHKSLYGLKQAPRAWYEKIDTYFLSNSFKRCVSDPNLYVKNIGDDILIIVLYVDDLIITGSQLISIQKLKENLRKEFEMTDLGLLHYFLGLQIWHMADGIFLSQPKYASDLLARFKMSDCKACASPFQSGVKLIVDCTTPLVDATLYRQLIGSLIYLTHSRPDISFAVSMVSRFMQKPHESHWLAAKRILRYIQGSMHYGVFYSSNTNVSLLGYTDSDWAGDCSD